MIIGRAALETKLPARTIRYYEDIGLIQPSRAQNGYRDYSDADVHRLRFLQRARDLGFSIEECRLLLSLYDDQNRASADVKTLAQNKIREIEQKVNELKALKSALQALADNCHGDERPSCPIMDDLAGGGDCPHS